MPQRWRRQGSRFGGFEFRRLSAMAYEVKRLSKRILSGLLLLYATACGVLVLYLIKSALGIDLIEGFSFGVWGWFQEHVLKAL